MLQCGAVWCSVVHCVAVCGSVVQCGAVRCSVLQCGAVWCSVVQCVALCCTVLHCVAVCCHGPVRLSVLQHDANDIQMMKSVGWLRLVGSLKLQVSFAEYRLFYGHLLQKRPII